MLEHYRAYLSRAERTTQELNGRASLLRVGTKVAGNGLQTTGQDRDVH